MTDSSRLDPKQLVWRCRRGVRELDVLLGRFLDSVYKDLNDDEQLAFERLLEVQDPIIMDWLLDKYASEDQEIVSIIKRLQLISGLK